MYELIWMRKLMFDAYVCVCLRSIIVVFRLDSKGPLGLSVCRAPVSLTISLRSYLWLVFDLYWLLPYVLVWLEIFIFMCMCMLMKMNHAARQSNVVASNNGVWYVFNECCCCSGMLNVFLFDVLSPIRFLSHSLPCVADRFGRA